MKIKTRLSEAFQKANPKINTYSAGAMRHTREWRVHDVSESELATMKAKVMRVKKYDKTSKKTKLYKVPMIEIEDIKEGKD